MREDRSVPTGRATRRGGVPPTVPRREFLAALGGAGAAALSAAAHGAAPAPHGGPRPDAAPRPERGEMLALDGGEPVRRTPLRARLYGPLFFDDEERRELQDVLDARSPFRWWGSGPAPPEKVRKFEAELAERIGVRHALGVTSGTTALMTAMAALEVGPGDEVVLPSWTWYADYDAIVLAGALPVFVEIDESFDLDPEDLDRKITPRTKAILAIHLQGTPCDMGRVLEIARGRGVKVLEDCAQCVGGRYGGRYVGSMGDIGIFSFQVNKTITAGEGGAVVTSDPVLFERAARFHDVGVIREPHRGSLAGGILGRFTSANFRMNEFTGAVLRAQLRKLDRICSGLREAFRSVREGVRDLPGIRFRKTPDREGDLGIGVFLDLGTRERRDRFLRAMEAEGVPATPPGGSAVLPVEPYIREKATVHPGWPTFLTKEGREIRYGPETCPRTLDILGRHAGVIMDPKFSPEELQDIVRAIRKVYPALG